MNKNLDTQSALSASDLLIEKAEQELVQPNAEGMRILQSMVADPHTASAPVFSNSSNSNKLPGFSAPAAGSPGLVAAGFNAPWAGGLGSPASDMLSAASAVGLAGQVAAAAPAQMGKPDTAQAEALDHALKMGFKAVDELKEFLTPDPLNTTLQNSLEFQQLQAMLSADGLNAAESQMLSDLVSGINFSGSSAQGLEFAIQALEDQIALLTNTFEPYLDGLTADALAQASDLSA